MSSHRIDAAAFALAILVLSALTGGCRPQNEAAPNPKPESAAKAQSADWMTAVKQGDAAKVKMLLDSGADIEARDPADGRTALMFAALQRRNALVDLLLQRGAKIETQDDEGVTALMWAAFGNNPDAVRALRKAGASLKTKDKYGKTAQDWGKDHAAVVAALKG